MPRSAPSGNCWPTSNSTTTIRAHISMNIVYNITTTKIITITTCLGTKADQIITTLVQHAGTFDFTIVYNKGQFFNNLFPGRWTNNKDDYEAAFATKIAPYMQEASNSQSFILNPGTEIINTIKDRVCVPERKCKGVIITPETKISCGQSVWKRTIKQVEIRGVRLTSSGGNCMLD